MERKSTTVRTKKKKSLKRNPLIKKSLNTDTYLEIFSHIPFKKVVQWRSVCKSWLTLLDDNILINIHAKSLLKLPTYDHHLGHNNTSCSSIVSFVSFSKEQTSLLFGFYDDNLSSYKESSFNVSSSNLKVATLVNSCNGLVCLKTTTEGFQPIQPIQPIAIYNPVTTEFLRLPPSINDGAYYYRSHVGFGYHPSTKEYKILRIINRKIWLSYLPNTRLQIYTLGTTSEWKDVEEWSADRRFFSYDVPGVHVNGVLYWIKEEKNTSVETVDNKKRKMIMSFDLADEKFRFLTMLPTLLLNDMNPKPHYKLVESQGRLFLFVDHYSGLDYPPHVELWVMKEEKDDIDYDNGGFRYYWSNLMKITTVAHKKEDYEFLALTQSGKMLFRHKDVLTCFDPKTETFAWISDVPVASSRRYCSGSDMVPHTNSLVSLIALGAIPKKKKNKD